MLFVSGFSACQLIVLLSSCTVGLSLCLIVLLNCIFFLQSPESHQSTIKASLKIVLEFITVYVAMQNDKFYH